MFFRIQLLVASIHSIIAPDFSITTEKKLSTNKLRNTVTQQLKNHLSDQLNCVEKFVTTYLSQQPSRIIVVLTDDNVSDVSYAYLTQLQQTRSTYVLTKHSISSAERNASLDVIIIMKNNTDIENTTLKLNELCGRSCRYLVLLIDNFTDKELFINNAKNLVQLMWIKTISSIVIIGLVEESLVAAESSAFKPNIFRQLMDPVIVGTCQNSVWTLKKGFILEN